MDKLVRSRNQILGLTHFICVPLATVSSMPVLQQSLGVLRHNPAIPPGALVPPGMLQINVGITMNLSTPSQFARAKQLLESLNLNSLARELTKPFPTGRSVRDRFLELEKSLSLSSVAYTNQPLPLHVTLSSLDSDPPAHQDNAINLYA